MWTCHLIKIIGHSWGFVNNTNLSFLYKIRIEVPEKNKVSSSGNWTWNWPSLVYKSDAYPNVLRRHVLTVSDFQILTKSCSLESRNDPSPKSGVAHEIKVRLKISYLTHVCLAQLDLRKLRLKKLLQDDCHKHKH